jgi:integrase
MKNLTRRPNGVWYVRKVVDGKVRRISTGQTDKKFAEKVARKILGDFDKGLVDDVIGARKAKIPTYGEVARNVIATVKHTNVYKYSLAATIAAWDDKRVDLLTATDCLTFLKTQLATGRSRNCIKQSVDLSSAVFNRAIADGVKMQNPWRLVPKKARPKAQPRDRVLSHEDEEKLLAELPPVINRIARVQLGAGLRIGEVLALVPKRDLDFANGFFRLSATKGEKPRSVPMFLDGSKRCSNSSPNSASRSRRTRRSSAGTPKPTSCTSSPRRCSVPVSRAARRTICGGRSERGWRSSGMRR